jgi:predicted ATPase
MQPELSITTNSYHGREYERKYLNEIFDKSIEQSRYVTISGRSGGGKTALVKSRNWEEEKKCYFVTGKFELNQSSQPFSAIVDALSDLSSKWSSTEEGKQEIRDFCQKNPQDESCLRKFLPNLYRLSNCENLLDDDSDYGDISRQRASTSFERLRTVVCKLLECIVKPSRPVMILLYEIQWADEQSLALIEFLVAENLKGLFLLSTYSSENVDEKYPLRSRLTQLSESKEAKGRVNNIHLSDLTLDAVHNILSRAMNKDKVVTISLVEVIYEKTGGHPFFVDQFLKLLQREGYLSFSFMSCQWEWIDVAEIRQGMSIICSKVADVVASSMRRLEGDIQEVLKVASCLGSEVPLDILEEYFAWEQRDNEDILEVLVQNSILKRPSRASTLYFWAHDNIQQAAFSLISEDELDSLRLKLGKVAFKISSRETGVKQEALIYISVDQLNRVPCIFLLQNAGDIRLALVRLNIQAAKLCTSKSAFYPAHDLLQNGLSLLNTRKKYSV